MTSSDRRRSYISEFIMDIVSVLHRNRFIVSELIAYMFVRHCLLASWRRWTCLATGRAAALVVASPTLLSNTQGTDIACRVHSCRESMLHGHPISGLPSFASGRNPLLNQCLCICAFAAGQALFASCATLNHYMLRSAHVL